MHSVDTFSDAVRRAMDWAPDWAVGIVLLAVAVLGALALHAIASALVARAFENRRPFLYSLLRVTRGPTRAAFIVFAVGAVMPSAPFHPAAREAFVHALQIAFIILTGWVALTASQLAASAYLSRFPLDVDDNLRARKHVTQIRILKRALDTLIVIVVTGAVLMTFESVRQFGVSLFASAGVAGLVIGFAARPVLQNLIAGMQIAVTQPIRINDWVVVENESGTIEEITSTYVVVRAWDLRRLIIPLGYFIEKPFQNWTRDSTALLGTIFLQVDYSAPVAAIRGKFDELVKSSPLWNGVSAALQVTEARERTMELRALVSANTASALWELRCDIREKLIDFLQREHPDALPQTRAHVALEGSAGITVTDQNGTDKGQVR